METVTQETHEQVSADPYYDELNRLFQLYLLANLNARARTVSAGLAAIISGVTPFCGWSEKVRDLRSLRFAYSQLFGQIASVITEIKRAGAISSEHVGIARMVHDAYTRIEALDELAPNQKLIDREDAKVRKAFPDDYLWTHF